MSAEEIVIEAATLAWADECRGLREDIKRLEQRIADGRFLVGLLLQGSTYSGNQVTYHNQYVGDGDRLSSKLARWRENSSDNTGVDRG